MSPALEPAPARARLAASEPARARSETLESLASLALRGAASLGGLALLAVAVRALGAAEAGRLYTAFGLALIAAALGQAGRVHLVARRVAVERSGADGGAAAYADGLRAAARASVAIAGALALGARPLARHVFGDAGVAAPLALLALGVPALAVLWIQGDVLKGLGRPLAAQGVASGAVPWLAVAPIALLAGRGGAAAAAGAIAACAVGAALVVHARLRRALQPGDDPTSVPAAATGARDLFVVTLTGLVALRAGSLLCAVFGASADVVAYEAALRTVGVATLVLAGVQAPLVPHLARDLAHGDLVSAERRARATARLGAAIAVPLLALPCLAPALVERAFGLPGAHLGPVLGWLALGELANALTGPCVLLLLMGGRERVVRDLALAGTAVGVAVGAAAVPALGPAGAALGACAHALVTNLGAALAARRTLGVVTLPFGRARAECAAPVRLAFAVVGAQKAGTTTLHAWLAAQDEVGLPDVKETHWFSHPERAALGAAWYAERFAAVRDRRLLGEVDPEYLPCPDALRRLRAHSPPARVAVVLRDPLARARSQHAMSVARGLEELPFEAALEAEAARLAAAEPGDETWLHRAYLHRSRYAEQLQRLDASFPRRQVHLVRFEDLFGERRRETFAELCTFLGLERPDLDVVDGGARNARWSSRSRLVAHVLREGSATRRALRALVPTRGLRVRLGRLVERWNRRPAPRTDEPPLSEAWRERFAHEARLLEARTGWDLSGWCR